MRIRSAVLAILTLFQVSTPVDAGVRVVTTTTDLAAVARAVGGTVVEVESIALGVQDPHYVEAKPSFMRKLNRADLLVYNGLELEIGWLPLLIQGARNPDIGPGARGHLNASAGIEVLEVPEDEVSRAMGDIHPEGNPHYTLDPRNGRVIARSIADRLTEIDPENAPAYAAGLEAFEADLALRIADWEGRASALRGYRIVAHHKQWEYLTRWLGIEIADYVETKPGVPPSPRHVASLIARIRSERIGVVVAGNVVDPRASRRIAEQSGARHLVLPVAVGGAEGIETYSDLFDRIITRLAAAHSASP